MDIVAVTLEEVIQLHGDGIPLCLLQGLGKAHAVHFESTKHGLFVKMHFSSQDDAPRRKLRLDKLVPSDNGKQTHVKVNRWYSAPPSVAPPSPPYAVQIEPCGRIGFFR